MRRGGLVVLAWLLALGWTVPGATAQGAGGERIRSYDVVLTVAASGRLEVSERIAYDFGAAGRHGIERFVPTTARYDRTTDRRYPLRLLGVTATGGASSRTELRRVGADTVLRIGDPGRTVTGLHTYTIRYTVDGTLNGFSDHDELFWNAIGTEWTVPIDSATASVDAPAPITQVACYSGPAGSRLPCASARTDGTQATFTASALGAGEGLTVVAALPRGVVPPPRPILVEHRSLQTAFAVTPVTVVLAVLVAVAGFGLVARAVLRTGRDRRYVGSPVDVAFGSAGGAEEPVPVFERFQPPVEFGPPDGLRAGQLGTLIDEVANPLDVTATIVDLAVRGYLRIDEEPRQGLFHKQDWSLVRLRDGSDLAPFERALFDNLFAGSSGSVALSALKDHFAPQLHQVQDALYDDAVAQGWFATRPDRVRATWTGFGALVLVAGIAIVVAAALFTHWALVAVPVPLVGIDLMIVASRMPARTARGTGVLRRTLGFRRFMEESEGERARFAEQQHLFSEYLPYAIVFGCTDRWARAFAGLDGELPTQSWYVGPHPFTTPVFLSAVDGFTTTTAGTLTSTPASTGSSGFGGGGFSGGGGGGGGGGSW